MTALFSGTAASAITAWLFAPPATPQWFTVWQASGGQNAIGGMAGRTLRVRIPRETLDVSGTKVRVTFKAGGGGMTIPNAFIGIAETRPTSDWQTTEPWDFEAAPTRLTFGGANSSGAIAAGATKLSDEMNFVVDCVDDLLISFHNADEATPFFVFGGQAQGAQGWIRHISGDDAATIDTHGYGGGDVAFPVIGVSKLEVYGFAGNPGGIVPQASYPIGIALTNPGAEAGNLTGWITIIGSPAAVTAGGAVPHPPVNSGTYMFSGTSPAAEMTQTFDLTTHPQWTALQQDINNGITHALALIWQRSFLSADRGTVFPYIKCLDASNALLGQVADLPTYFGVFTEQVAGMILPKNTAKLVLGIRFDRVLGTGDIRTYFDDAQLVLNYKPLAVADPYPQYTLAHFAADDGAGVDYARRGVPWGMGDQVKALSVGGTAVRVIESIVGGGLTWPDTHDTLFVLGADDWTFEGYFTFDSATVTQQDLFANRGNTSFGVRQSYRLGPVNGFWTGILRYGAADNTIVATSQVVPNVEHHVIFTRHGGTVYLRINGVVEATLAIGTAALQTPSSQDTRRIFYPPANGRGDAIRFTPGLCRYPGSGAYAVPARPLPRPAIITAPVHDNFDNGSIDQLWDQVITLGKFVGTDGQTTQSDSSQSARAITLANGAKISSTVTMFGGNMGYVDGVNDYVSVARGTGFWGASESLCLEGHFIFPTFATTGDRLIMGQYRSATNGRGLALYRNEPNLRVYIGTSSGSTGTVLIDVPHGMSVNTPYHLTVTRDIATNIYRLYKDGVLLAKVSNAVALYNPAGINFTIGGQQDGATHLQEMRFREVRITTGHWRYNWDDGFKKPTSPFALTD